MYTDTFIQELISCKKRIIDGPKTLGQARGSDKTVFTMQSADGAYDFSAFISVNSQFQENFSVGLVFIPKQEKGKLCLLRVNGFHGETEDIPHNSTCHIHTVRAEDIESGIKSERHIVATTAYSTVETAIRFYLTHINVIPQDISKHFPPPSNQIQIFE
jgi:hypothetical protein